MNHKTAYYHLPGLFECYELYRVFLPLYRAHREYFYDCAISALCTARRRTVSGAAAVSEAVATPPGRYWP